MTRRCLFGSKQREAVWSVECERAQAVGRGDVPICNLCDLPVLPTDRWDRSHVPERPRSFGGKQVGVAHERCNREHGAQVVVPALARANRLRWRAIGAAGPGLGRYPMPGGVRSKLSKTFNKGVVLRLTLAQRHAATMRRRAILTQPTVEESP